MIYARQSNVVYTLFMIISKIKIHNFRKIKDLNIEFGKNITIIAGRNGTQKTSLLGLIAGAFDFSNARDKKDKEIRTLSKKAYLPIENKDYYTILDSEFKESFQKLNKIDKNNEKDSIIAYDVYLSQDLSKEVSKSYFAFEDGKYSGHEDKHFDDTNQEYFKLNVKGKNSNSRFVVVGHDSGQGHFPAPVIYLGLRRLYPIGELRGSVKFDHQRDGDKYDDFEKQIINQAHKEILFCDDDIEPQIIDHRDKQNTGGKTKSYNSLGFSAGQDNLGQIISAMLSFKKLQQEMKDQYNGGLLIIDEIEASFHPHAKEKLIEWIINFDKTHKLRLQIIFTTHCIDLIDIVQKNKTIDAIINMLYIKDSKVSNAINPSFLQIKDNMNIGSGFSDVYLVCEDSEAKIFMSTILDILKLEDRFEIVLLPNENLDKKTQKILYNGLGNGKDELAGKAKIFRELSHIYLSEIVNLAKNIYFVPDGDKPTESNSQKGNIFNLPGELCPEALIYDMVKTLQDDDSIFNDSRALNPKEKYFRDHNNRPGNRKAWKEWFKHCQTIDNDSVNRFFKRWIELNPEPVKQFESKLNDILGIKS